MVNCPAVEHKLQLMGKDTNVARTPERKVK
jgi:hypothetical protein